MITPVEKKIVNMLKARRGEYMLDYIKHDSGRYYDVSLNGKRYNAVVLPKSFDFWQLRYHLAEIQPELVICLMHDTTLHVPVLSLEASNLAEPYALPERIKDLKAERWSRTGTRILLGLYLLGVHSWVDYIEKLPDTTRKRYLRRAKELAKRPEKGGRPVGLKTKTN